jgi:hypothetical protein
MVSDDTVATAAHCVHGGAGGGFFTNHVVYPGQDGASSPYGSSGAARPTRCSPTRSGRARVPTTSTSPRSS